MNTEIELAVEYYNSKQTRQPNPKFKDCLGKPIAVGDVIAHGFRSGDRGGISVGIVYGFTETTVQFYRFEPQHCPYKSYRTCKSCTRVAENTFITGLTEAQLMERLNDYVNGTVNWNSSVI
jgi:hypothetical protein